MVYFIVLFHNFLELMLWLMLHNQWASISMCSHTWRTNAVTTYCHCWLYVIWEMCAIFALFLEKNIISFVVSLWITIFTVFTFVMSTSSSFVRPFFRLHCVLCPELQLVAIQLHPLDLIPTVWNWNCDLRLPSKHYTNRTLLTERYVLELRCFFFHQ